MQIARGNFDPNSGYVEARGSFLTSGGNWVGGFTLTNDPANDPLVYRGTWVDTNAPGGVVQYQYVLNGGTWESTGNRTFTLTDTNPVTRPLEFFSNVADLGALTAGPVSAGQMQLSWTGGTLIRLQNCTNLTENVWQTVDGTEGQSSATVNVDGSQAYFRLVGP